MSDSITDLEKFAFFNRQLSGMLDAGVPMEKGIRRLVRDMRRGEMKRIFSRIGERLRRGESFGEAVEAFKDRLPGLYWKLCIVGDKSEQLPEVLNGLASFYRWKGSLKGRLQTLMIYPTVVMVAALIVSVGLAVVMPTIIEGVTEGALMTDWPPGRYDSLSWLYRLPYFYAGGVGVILITYVMAVYTPYLKPTTDYIVWYLKPTRYLKLATISRMFHVLLDGGVSTAAAFGLMRELSENRFTRRAIENMQDRIEKGVTVPEAFEEQDIFPSTYCWVLKNSGEQLPAGFRENAELYGERARRYLDICLYAAVPLALILVGGLVLANFGLIFYVLERMMGGLA